jgi:hypothetical protein
MTTQNYKKRLNNSDAECLICDDVQEYLDNCAQNDSFLLEHVNPAGRGIVDDPSWVGRRFSSYSDLRAQFNQAWTEGITTCEKMLDDLRNSEIPRPVCRQRKTRWRTDSGDSIDLDRLRAGQDFWRSTERESKSGPQSVVIVADIAANSDVTARDMLWRGAAAIAMCQILEEAGYRCEFWSASHSVNVFSGDQTHAQALLVKRAEDPIDMSTLVNVVSGWWFRSVIFSLRLLSKQYAPSSYQIGRSFPLKNNSDWLSEFANTSSGEHVLLLSDVWNRRDAVAAINRLIASLHVDMQPA